MTLWICVALLALGAIGGWLLDVLGRGVRRSLTMDRRHSKGLLQ